MTRQSNICYLYIITFLLLAPKLTSARFLSARGPKCDRQNCNNPLAINIKQIQRLQRIKQQILVALGFPSVSHSRNRTSGKQPRANDETSGTISLSNRTDSYSGGPELISFSQSIGKRHKKRRLLQFVIQTGKQNSDLEVVSAYLWLLVKKRRKDKPSKTIVLKVFKVEKKKKYELTYLRTRVKETKWQKLSLPISLVQDLLQPPEGRLKLKIECKRCGRTVKLVLPRGHKHNKTKIIPPTRTLRLRNIQRRRPRPFLVINTRIKIK